MDKDIKKIIRSSYTANAASRDRQEIESWKIQELDKLLSNYENPVNKRLLDLGAGNGLYGAYLRDKGFNVTCIDLSPGMIDLCVKKGLNAMEMDFYNLKFEDNSFDTIWSLNTLLHVPKKSLHKVLKETKRVLKADGVFYIGIYGGKSFEGILEDDFYEPKRFFAFYEDSELKCELEKYFDIVSFKSSNLEDRDYIFQSIILQHKR